MDKMKIGTALALIHLKCNSIDSLDQRILLQKKMYMAQSYGVAFNYNYNWYIHGPYAKSLTSDAYEIIPINPDELSGYTLKTSVSQILDKVNNLALQKPDNLTEVSWYELLASLLYLKNEYGINGLKQKRDITEKLIEYKPWYTEKDINTAWDVAVND